MLLRTEEAKSKFDKSLNIPDLLYGVEVWTLSTTDGSVLEVFDRKVLGKMYGLLGIDVKEELPDILIYGDIDIDSSYAGQLKSFVRGTTIQLWKYSPIEEAE